MSPRLSERQVATNDVERLEGLKLILQTPCWRGPLYDRFDREAIADLDRLIAEARAKAALQ